MQSNKLLESGKTVLPFGIIREDNYMKYEKITEYSPEQAMLSGLLDGVKIKREKYNESELKSVKYDFVEKEEKVEINLKINCIEDIAEESLILTES